MNRILDSKKILVVDDDAGIRQSLARILRGSGYKVEVAADGEQAIATAESFEPDVLLVDMRMPGIDGIETHRRLQRRFPDLVAITMTAFARPDQTEQAITDGMVSVLSKPLDIDSLMEMVQSV